jgi:four helix bundle protein
LGTISPANAGGLCRNLEISQGRTLWPNESIRRCAVSIGANIAEGCGKMGNNEFQRYLQIAAGSASELDYELLLAKDLGYLPKTDYERAAGELLHLRKTLSSLLRKVNLDRTQ